MTSIIIDHQDDHVFVSDDLATRVAVCDVADRKGLSDHSPLRLILEQALQTVA